MMSCSFGVVPRSRIPATPDRFGRAFPDRARLAVLPDAMRHEAALLAAEAGLAAPPGSLPDFRPDPHRFPLDDFSGPAPAMTSRQLLDAFIDQRVELEEGAWLPIENVRAALHVFCCDLGESTPSDKGLARAMIARFGRPQGSDRAVRGFPGLTIRGGRS